MSRGSAFGPLLEECLKNVGHVYGPRVQRVRHDLSAVLRQNFPALQPAVDTLVLNTGAQNTLLCLTGTVAIVFEGNRYFTPVKIWITAMYPVSGPICFVCPTKDMVIKKNHMHVDLAGMIYLPFLSKWRQDSSLVEMIKEMSQVFSRDPPLRSAPPTPLPPDPQKGLSHGAQQRPGGRVTSSSGGAGSSRGGMTGGETDDPLIVVKQNIIGELSERLKPKVKEFNSGQVKEMDGLLERQAQLKKSSADTLRTLGYLRAEKESILANLGEIDQKHDLASSFLLAHEGEDEPDLDESTTPRDPLMVQMVYTAAEVSALEDSMYYLDKALQRERLSLDAFVKSVRRLSRDQFLRKALLRKIQNTIRSR